MEHGADVEPNGARVKCVVRSDRCFDCLRAITSSVSRRRGNWPRAQGLLEMRSEAMSISSTEPDDRALRRYRAFTWGYVLYGLAVMAWGTYVRATGSGAGCGAHWPLCNGEVVPRSPALETLVELTHRVTSGLAWLLAPLSWFWARRLFPPGHPARRFAGWTWILMTTESLLGAGLVLLEMTGRNESVARAAWTGGHLIHTFLLLGVMVATWHAARPGAAYRWRGHGALGLTLGLAAGAVSLAAMSGAVAALGDTLFPAESLRHGLQQDFSPTAHLFLRLRVLHPTLAIWSSLFVGAACWLAFRRPGLRRAAVGLAVLQMLQLDVGVANLLLLAPVWMQVLHLMVADLLWIALVWLGLTMAASGAMGGAVPRSAAP